MRQRTRSVRAQVQRTLRVRRLVTPGDRVVVACSGGPDSTVLLHVLSALAPKISLQLVVASVDHGLRPEARLEVEHVGRMAAAFSLPFRPLRVDLSEGASASLQARAREARYGALLQLAVAEGADRIAVGHTQDDQAETVLGRLLRGAGVAGLSGIAPRRADGVIRPLIDCRRADVRAYAAFHALEVVEDPSNADMHYERVRIRRKILPILVEEDAGLVQHLADLSDDARATMRYLRARGRRLVVRARVPESPDCIAISVLRAAPDAVLRAALRSWLEERTGSKPLRAHVRDVEALLSSPGEVWMRGGWRARVFGGNLVAERAPKTEAKRKGVPG